MSLFTVTHKHIHHFDPASAKAFGEIQQKLETLMIDTSKLLAAVAREKTDNDSLRALVTANTQALSLISTQLADAIAKLDASGTDTAALAAVQADLDKAATDLSLDSDKTEAALAASVPQQNKADLPGGAPVDAKPLSGTGPA